MTLVLKGKIKSVEAGEETSSLVVAVKKTNRHARRYRGKRIKGFAPPLEDFRMLPQLIVAERPAAEETPETEAAE